VLQGRDGRRPRLREGVPRLRDHGGRMTRVSSLAEGLEPVRRWFNDKSAFVRVVAIQSPT
jgi:hypothetical protein